MVVERFLSFRSRHFANASTLVQIVGLWRVQLALIWRLDRCLLNRFPDVESLLDCPLRWALRSGVVLLQLWRGSGKYLDFQLKKVVVCASGSLLQLVGLFARPLVETSFVFSCWRRSVGQTFS